MLQKSLVSLILLSSVYSELTMDNLTVESIKVQIQKQIGGDSKEFMLKNYNDDQSQELDDETLKALVDEQDIIKLSFELPMDAQGIDFAGKSVLMKFEFNNDKMEKRFIVPVDFTVGIIKQMQAAIEKTYYSIEKDPSKMKLIKLSKDDESEFVMEDDEIIGKCEPVENYKIEFEENDQACTFQSKSGLFILINCPMDGEHEYLLIFVAHGDSSADTSVIMHPLASIFVTFLIVCAM